MKEYTISFGIYLFVDAESKEEATEQGKLAMMEFLEEVPLMSTLHAEESSIWLAKVEAGKKADEA